MKNIRIFLSEIFQFLEVKFSLYLNRCVFVMNKMQTSLTRRCSLFVTSYYGKKPLRPTYNERFWLQFTKEKTLHTASYPSVWSFLQYLLSFTGKWGKDFDIPFIHLRSLSISLASFGAKSQTTFIVCCFFFFSFFFFFCVCVFWLEVYMVNWKVDGLNVHHENIPI